MKRNGEWETRSHRMVLMGVVLIVRSRMRKSFAPSKFCFLVTCDRIVPVSGNTLFNQWDVLMPGETITPLPLPHFLTFQEQLVNHRVPSQDCNVQSLSALVLIYRSPPHRPRPLSAAPQRWRATVLPLLHSALPATPCPEQRSRSRLPRS